jgi:hypothetical protein
VICNVGEARGSKIHRNPPTPWTTSCQDPCHVSRVTCHVTYHGMETFYCRQESGNKTHPESIDENNKKYVVYMYVIVVRKRHAGGRWNFRTVLIFVQIFCSKYESSSVWNARVSQVVHGAQAPARPAVSTIVLITGTSSDGHDHHFKVESSHHQRNRVVIIPFAALSTNSLG